MWAAFLGLTALLAVLTEELQLGWDGRRGEGSTLSKDGLPSFPLLQLGVGPDHICL